MRKIKVLLAAGLLVFAGVACGNDDDDGDAASGDAAGNVVEVVAKDFAFVVPESIKGGTVVMDYENQGTEGHFAAFAKVADGKTFADVKAALTAPADAAPPAGPPPFVEWAGAAGTDPGGSARLTFDLPAGTYALFCSIPSPDGVSHAVKGMVSEVTVTEGETKALPDGVGTITGTDFALTVPPEMEAGTNVVKLANNGKQLHEIDLIELPEGKTLDDVVAWHTAPQGPPPNKSLGGIAVAPGQQGTAEFDLKSGTTYAFICAIPDVLGDFKAHLVKGMRTETFTVS